MREAQRFNFVEGFDAFGVPDALPQLLLALTYRGVSTFDVCFYRSQLVFEVRPKSQDTV